MLYYEGLNNIRKIFDGIKEYDSVADILAKYKDFKKEEIRHKLFFSVIRFVSKKASAISKKTNYSYEDLFQVGCLAVLEVVETFNPKKQDFFKAVVNRVNIDMFEEVSANKHTVTVPSQKITDYNRYRKFLEDTKETILEKKQKIDMLHNKYKTRLGEETFYQLDGIITHNIIPVSSELFKGVEASITKREDVLDNIIKIEEIKLVKKMMKKLTPIERDSVNAQYGGSKRIYFRDLAKKYRTKNMNRFTLARDRGLKKLKEQLVKLIA